jgi:hypothetical protein
VHIDIELEVEKLRSKLDHIEADDVDVILEVYKKITKVEIENLVSESGKRFRQNVEILSNNPNFVKQLELFLK